MIFSCSKCKTRYSLPDEKVAGRVLKVRCKTCGVVILVRDPALAPRPGASERAPEPRGAASGASSHRAHEPAHEDVWFVALGGRQEGPLGPAALAELVRSGAVDEGTWVWHPGMENWARSAEVPEVARWIAELAPPPSRPEPLPARPEAPLEAAAPRDRLGARHLPRTAGPATHAAMIALTAEQVAKLEAAGIEPVLAPEPASPPVAAPAPAAAAPAPTAAAPAPTAAAPAPSAVAPAAAPAPATAAPEPAAVPEPSPAAPEPSPAASAAAASSSDEEEIGGATEPLSKDEAARLLRELQGIPEAAAEAPAAASEAPPAAPDAPAPPEASPGPAEAPAAPAAPVAVAGAGDVEPSGAPLEAKRPATGEEEILLDEVELFVDAPIPDVPPPDEPAPLLPLPAEEAGGDLDDPGFDAVAREIDLFAEYEARGEVSHGLGPAATEAGGEAGDETEPAGAGDRAFFKQAMREAPSLESLTRIRPPTKAEMHDLRQEFSVVAHLHAHKKRHTMALVVGAAVVVALVVAAVVITRSEREARRTENLSRFQADGPAIPVAEYKARYDAAVKEAERTLHRKLTEEEKLAIAEKVKADTEAAAAALAPAVSAAKPAPAAKKPEAPPEPKPAAKAGTQVARFENKKLEKLEDGKSTFRSLSKEEYAALTAEGGKSEVKIDFDPGARAAAAEKAAEEKKAKLADDRTEKVIETFGRKTRQLARCKDDFEEKVKAQFTVAPSGRVTSVTVTGTKSSTKAKCVKEIIENAIFASGPDSATYGMPFTL